MLSEDEIRELLIERVEKEKQTYIGRQLDIPKYKLSAFKLGKRRLSKAELEKLEAYLLGSSSE